MKAIRLLTVLVVALQASSLWAQQQELPPITMSAGIGASPAQVGAHQGIGEVTLDCGEIFPETGTPARTIDDSDDGIFIEEGGRAESLSRS